MNSFSEILQSLMHAYAQFDISAHITNPYCLIFYNSMQADFLLALRSESAWFAALQFGVYNIALATLAAFVGSTIGMSINYGLGYYISRWRTEVPIYNEATYSRLVAYFRNYLFLILAIPPILILEFLPGLALFAVVCGMFRVPPKQAIGAIAFSRALYYIYHLVAVA